MSPNKSSLLRILLTAKAGCGCGRPNPVDVYEPTPKPKLSSPSPNSNPASSLTSSTTTASGDRNGGISLDGDGDADECDFTSTTVSEAETEHRRSFKNMTMSNHVRKQSPIVDSVAVEKESEDPYKDFRLSMLQMIFEKEIYSESELGELLEAFLDLNSPGQHEVIVKAFTEICQEAFPSNKKKKKKKTVTCSGHVKKQPLARA